MKIKIVFFTLALLFVVGSGYKTTHAESLAPYTSTFFKGPKVSSVTPTSAIFTLSSEVVGDMVQNNPQAINGVYFEYYKTNQVCIAIYPTPEYCLPKKTNKGVTSVEVKDLTPNTEYTVVYKVDNTIACITTPCPTNSYTSLEAKFKTPASNGDGTSTTTPRFMKNFGHKARGVDVSSLQKLLIENGYMKGSVTGYFGTVTLKAVKDFQRANGITPTGFVGPMTRTQLGLPMTVSPISAEYFEGTITAVSTGCFSDGECSITVSGKKVVTTIGWSQQTVGSIIGSVTSVGDAESKIGSRAKVYAQKTSDGYTLYGASNYYIEIQ